MQGPHIEVYKCDGCGLCVSVCVNHGLQMAGDVVVFVGGDACSWCGECEAVCETGAITCPYDIVIEDSA